MTDGVSSPSVSADGRRIAFVGDGNQVWVRDVVSGATMLASRAGGAGGAAGNGIAFAPTISADGNRVAFMSDATNLAPTPIPPATRQIWVRDMSARTTIAASRADGADGNLFVGGPGASDFRQSYLRAFKANCGGRTTTSFGPHDTAEPVLRSVSLTRTRFRVAKSRTPLAATAKARRKAVGRGTALRFTSSEAGKLTILIERARPGRTSGNGGKRVCKPVRHRPKHGACTTYARVATLTRTIRAGSGRVALSGRIGKRRLAAAGYRLTISVRDSAGNVSKPTLRTFTIVAG